MLRSGSSGDGRSLRSEIRMPAATAIQGDLALYPEQVIDDHTPQ